jgi:hypothetical protein
VITTEGGEQQSRETVGKQGLVLGTNPHRMGTKEGKLCGRVEGQSPPANNTIYRPTPQSNQTGTVCVCDLGSNGVAG